MTYDCRDVLNHLRQISDKDTTILYFIHDQKRIGAQGNSEVRYYDYIKYQNSICSILDELEKKDCIKVVDNNSFFLTYRGFHPYKVVLDECKPKLIWSILVPIGISIFTTYITLRFRLL